MRVSSLTTSPISNTGGFGVSFRREKGFREKTGIYQGRDPFIDEVLRYGERGEKRGALRGQR